MTKTILYTLAAILLILACYFGYYWYISEPGNKEPLPALLAIGSSFISLIIAWRNESSNDKDNISLQNIQGGTLDIDNKSNTNISIKKVKGDKTRILINKGKDSLNPPREKTNHS